MDMNARSPSSWFHNPSIAFRQCRKPVLGVWAGSCLFLTEYSTRHRAIVNVLIHTLFPLGYSLMDFTAITKVVVRPSVGSWRTKNAVFRRDRLKPKFWAGSTVRIRFGRSPSTVRRTHLVYRHLYSALTSYFSLAMASCTTHGELNQQTAELISARNT